MASFGHFSTPLGPSVRRLGFRPCRSCRSCRVWRLSPIALHPDCQRAHSPNVSIRHTGSLRRAGGRVSGNSPLFRRFSIPASSSASHSVATDHCSRAAVLPYSPLATRHSPLPPTTLPPLATAIHQPPNCQRPNGTRSRRAAPLCQYVTETGDSCGQNQLIPPHSPPPDR